jgi:hypothetical protein
MTPKEKAVQLYGKYFEFTTIMYEHDYTKKCILITADTVLDALDDCWEQDVFMVKFWQEVKKEIEKL